MATQATIQARIAAGLAKVAARLGAPCAWYRPTGSSNPLSAQYLLGTLDVALDTVAFLSMRTPQARGKAESWYAACDLSLIQIGDYLVDATNGTFFVTATTGFSPARLASCNSTVSVYRPEAATPGAGFYGGDVTAGGETLLLTAWPCAVTQGTKGESGEARLPGDTRLPWFSVLLPATSGVQIRTGDVLVDTQAIPARYTISSAELTSMGWRLSAALATP